MKVFPLHEPGPEHFVTVLLVSPWAEDHQSRREIFAHTNWRLTTADTAARALAALRSGRQAVVVCDSNLQQGSWKELLEQARAVPSQPLLILTSAHSDHKLWAEALNLGTYDVLPKPFERQEVVHVISAAWLHWRSRLRMQERLKVTRQLTASCA